MLKLSIKDTKVQTGAVAISWCTDRETLNQLKTHCRGEAKLVIIVAPEKGYGPEKQLRYEVPLASGLAFIEFRYSGMNNVFAFIQVDDLYDHTDFLDRRGWEWTSTVLNREGDDFSASWLHTEQMKTYEQGVEEVAASAEKLEQDAPEPPPPPTYNFREHVDQRSAKLRIEVPEGVFAKAAPEWEQKWVNWLCNSKPVDQCAYRRRRLLAYTPFLKPLGFMFLYLIRLGIVAFLLLGLLMRGINFRPLTSPLENESEDIWRNLDGPLFFNEKKDWYLIFLPVTPFFMAIAYGIWMLIFSATGAPFGLSWWALLLLAPVLVLAFCVAVGFVTLIIAGSVVLFKRIRKEREERKEIPTSFDEDAEEYLICSPDRRAVFTVSDLPKDQRTIRLRFQSFKAKVCRPFSA